MFRVQSEIFVHPRHVSGIHVVALVPGERVGIRHPGVLENEEGQKTSHAAYDQNAAGGPASFRHCRQTYQMDLLKECQKLRKARQSSGAMAAHSPGGITIISGL